MIVLILIFLGLCLGSFTNALVWRLYKQSKQKKPNDKYSIARGRSMCVNCKHSLSQLDLVPVVSWLALKGKCRYCKKKISIQYPIVELLTATLFVVSYLFWPYELESIEYLAFSAWLAILVGFVALIIYDLRWMLLPNKIVFPLYGLGLVFVAVKISEEFTPETILSLVTSVLIGGGLFYILFQVSKGKWIGGGDVKLGFLLGALVMKPELAFMVLFLASLLGCLYILPSMMLKKVTKKTRVPFGPFLITSTILVMLFGLDVLDWYFNLLLL